jgi:DNA-binding beta-propeller fold protein YncE
VTSEVDVVQSARGRPAALVLSFWILLTFVACSSGAAAPGSGGERAGVPGYRVLRDVDLPGDTSRWDYTAYDAAARRLYLAHLGASQIVVFDTARNQAVQTIDGVDSVHGLVLAPELGRLYASATGRNRLVAIDTATLHTVGSAPTGDAPDGVAYAPTSGKLFVSNEHGPGDTVIDARTMQRVADVQLGGDIGNSYYDPGTRLVYVVAGNDNRLVEVDPASAQAVGQYQLPGCSDAHGLQLDRPERHRAFVACAGNGRLVAVDLASGKVRANVQIGDQPDVLALDGGRDRLYVASESSQLAVLEVTEGVRKLGQGHTVAVDSQTHVAYLPLTSVGGRPVLRELVQTG